MKDVELKLVSELMKNARKSDRELARIIGVSQPTVTRIRTRLEKEGVVREYTMVPDFRKLGYHICAFNFIRLERALTLEELAEARKVGEALAKEDFREVIVAERGRGMGYQAVFVSFHESYAAYVEFVDRLNQAKLTGKPEIDGFLINLDDKVHYRYLTFSNLAKHLSTLERE